MRFLAFSCIHEKTNLVEKLVQEIRGQSLDFALIAGDIGEERHFKEAFRSLDQLTDRIFFVLGNWDGEFECSHPNAIHLHLNPVEIDEFVIVGFDHPAVEDIKKLAPILRFRNLRRIILVTHDPPFGILDKALSPAAAHTRESSDFSSGKERSIGSVPLRKVVDNYPPLLHIFAHAHTDGWRWEKIGNTWFVNVSNLDKTSKDGGILIGDYAIVEVTKDKDPVIEFRCFNGVIKVCKGCGKRLMLPHYWNKCVSCFVSDRRQSEL